MTSICEKILFNLYGPQKSKNTKVFIDNKMKLKPLCLADGKVWSLPQTDREKKGKATSMPSDFSLETENSTHTMRSA